MRRRIKAGGAPYQPGTETVSPPAGATPTPPTPKKKKKGIRGTIRHFLGLGKKWIPRGVGQTKEGRKEWKEIMEETK